MEQKLQASLGSKVVSWGKRIQEWFHFSKLGSGHTDAIELSGRASLILPQHTRYEGLWWHRKFEIDGPFHGSIVDREDALKSAEAYHNEVVMQNIKKFRRFFETSLNKTDRAHGYVDHFLCDVLTREGRDAVKTKLRRIFGCFIIPSCPTPQHIKVLMGFTRKRELFQSHWADDDKLWLG